MSRTQTFANHQTAEQTGARRIALGLTRVARLALLWPLAVVSAVAVKVEMGGSVLTHDADGARFRTTTVDGRVTRLGRFLRKAELDRLPGLLIA